jgi:hypothetical protein
MEEAGKQEGKRAQIVIETMIVHMKDIGALEAIYKYHTMAEKVVMKFTT